MRAKAGQLLAYGRCNRATGQAELRFVGGSSVVAEDVAWFRAMLTEPPRTIPGTHWPAFATELEKRGYDLATFRFSLFLKTAPEAAGKKRLTRLRLREGVLHARWGRDPVDGTSDLCCAWHRPGHKGDMSLFFSLMSIPLYLEDARAGGHRPGLTVRQELVARGFDICTLRFEVKKPLAGN